MTENAAFGGRVASLDALRGFIILAMLFVNDVAGVPGIPGWMKHYFPYEADGMTFVDVVFPAFLFIVGMAIPFALGRRRAAGTSLGALWRHILGRWAGLMIIGFFMVNSYSAAADGILPKVWWALLANLALIMVWNRLPDPGSAYRRLGVGIRIAGVVLLVLLAAIYRGNGAEGVFQMRTQWWGIIGLIGWAYLVGCIVWTFLWRNTAGLAGAISVLYCLFFADKMGAFNGIQPLRSYLDFGAQLGAHGALVVSGLLLGTMLAPGSPLESHGARLRWGAGFAAAMALCAWCLHTMRDLHPAFILNKNAATPAWCLYSAAITVAIWIAIYWLMDARGIRSWARPLQRAGENPLFAYVLAPVLYGVLAIVGAWIGRDYYAAWGQAGPAWGILRSCVLAGTLVWLVGFLKKYGIDMKT
jgi:predicted acyltransferase